MGGFESKLYETPWRQLPLSGNALEKKLVKDIQDLNPKLIPNILFLGPVGAGKTSVIGSYLSLSAGRKTGMGKGGNVELKRYTDSRLLKNFQLFDSMGIDAKFGHGFNPNDVVNLLKGHIKKGYKFNSDKPIPADSPYYRAEPKFEDEIHCIVFVIDANTIHETSDALVDKVQFLLDKSNLCDVPYVLILTKVDLLCERVHEDASNIFKSVRVHEAMKKASNLFSIDMASIHPVINNHEDIELFSANKTIPILLTLRQILQYSCDRVSFDMNDRDVMLDSTEQKIANMKPTQTSANKSPVNAMRKDIEEELVMNGPDVQSTSVNESPVNGMRSEKAEERELKNRHDVQSTSVNESPVNDMRSEKAEEREQKNRHDVQSTSVNESPVIDIRKEMDEEHDIHRPDVQSDAFDDGCEINRSDIKDKHGEENETQKNIEHVKEPQTCVNNPRHSDYNDRGLDDKSVKVNAAVIAEAAKAVFEKKQQKIKTNI